MSTPIFDEVMRDQGIDMMPLPPLPTHQDFLTKHGYEKFLSRADLILAGTVKPGRDEKGKFLPKGGGAPVKKKRRE